MVFSWTNTCRLEQSGSLSCANEYLAIDSGGCLCTKRVPALIAPWQITRDGGVLEMVSLTGTHSVERFEQSL